MTSTEHKESILRVLEGRNLTDITFMGGANGYIIFNFDGPVLQAYTLPIVTIEKKKFTVAMAGYYDSLCKQITKLATKTSEDKERIVIEFVDKVQIEISLKDEDSVCAEAAMFNVNLGKKNWMVWRPGD